MTRNYDESNLLVCQTFIDLLENVNGFTKSEKLKGIDIHAGYKNGSGFEESFKEYKRTVG